MRAIIKLAIVIAATLATQRGLESAARNAAEIEFQWAILSADIRGLPLDTPEMIDLAEPLIGVVHHSEFDRDEE